jgi:hypothetical protein
MSESPVNDDAVPINSIVPPIGSIVIHDKEPSDEEPADIIIIKKSIAQLIASAETSEDIKDALALRSELQSQIETSKNNQYQRQLGIVRENRLKVGSIIVMVIGCGLIAIDIFGKISYMGYPGLLFMLLAILKLLEYSPSEASGLIESFGSYLTKTNNNLPKSNPEDNQS